MSRPLRPRLALPDAWIVAALCGFAGLALGLAVMPSLEPSANASVIASIVAVGLMGAGMIAAAVAGRLWVGVVSALMMGTALIICAGLSGTITAAHLPSLLLAMVIASISFAARGALFARSALDKGRWIAVAVVAGEAAMLATASAMPGALPDWLLVLLPAQWASVAIRMALTGAGWGGAGAVLLALAGTAAATLLVAKLWPRRWPYLIMFTAWIGLSALVWQQTAVTETTRITAAQAEL